MNGPTFPKTKISLYVGEFLATLILRIYNLLLSSQAVEGGWDII